MSTARRSVRRNQAKELAAERERVGVMQAQLEAERLAWAELQKNAGSVLDPMTKARAAGAAITDAVLRKKHGCLLDNVARFVGC